MSIVIFIFLQFQQTSSLAVSYCPISGCHCLEAGSNTSIEIVCNGDLTNVSRDIKADFKIDYTKLKSYVITRLSIESFTLRELLPNIFKNLNITELELRLCHIEKLGNQSLAGILGLSRLELTANVFDDISEGFLAPVSYSLKHLRFRQNALTKVNIKDKSRWLSRATKLLVNIETIQFEAKI